MQLVAPIHVETVWIHDDSWPEGHELEIKTTIFAGEDEDITRLTWVAGADENNELQTKYLMSKANNAVAAVMVVGARGPQFEGLDFSGTPEDKYEVIKRLHRSIPVFVDREVAKRNPNPTVAATEKTKKRG